MPTTKRISFNGHDNIKLDARLELPDGKPGCYATFSNCFTCTKDTLAAFRVCKKLAQLGVATLRFDFAGLGGSEGDFADTNFSTMKLDLYAAVDYLARTYESPKLLIGHSMGGTTALACAGEIDSVEGVVTIASPSQPAHVLHHFGEALDALEDGLSASITVAGERYNIKPQFIDDIARHDMQDTLGALNKPLLIFSVTDDALVAAHNADDISRWTTGNFEVITLNNTDHVISDRATADAIATRIANWCKD